MGMSTILKLLVEVTGSIWYFHPWLKWTCFEHKKEDSRHLLSAFTMWSCTSFSSFASACCKVATRGLVFPSDWAGRGCDEM